MNPAELFRQDSGALTIAPGHFLFRQGENGDNMYVVLEGNVEILVGDLVVEVAGPGALRRRNGLDRCRPAYSERGGADTVSSGANRSTEISFPRAADATFRDTRYEDAG